MQRVVSALGLPKGFSVCELGAQTWDGRSAEGWYKGIGAARYVALDMSRQHGALPIDLNSPPGASDLCGECGGPGSYDLVTNNGTGEHLFSQAAAFQWAHDLAKPGALMVHILPWTGWLNHGFFSFQPILFRDLAQANGYELVGLYAGERNGRLERLDGNPAIDPWKDPKPHKERLTPIEQVAGSFGERANVSLVAILRRGRDGAGFQYPIQGKYQADWARFVAPKVEEEIPLTVLGNLQHTVCPEPFHHIVIPNALPAEIYAALAAQWPRENQIVKAEGDPALGNTLHQVSAHKVIGNPEFAPLWRKFFMKHTGEEWFRALMAVFGPQLAPILDKFPKPLKVGIRGTGEFNLAMDCQFAVNTPPKHTCRVRGPHLDSPDELLAGMLYFGDPADKQGGDLTLNRIKHAFPLYGKAEVPEGATEPAITVPYAPNTLVMFLNSASAVHSVTARAPGPHLRRYINFTLTADRHVVPMPNWDHALTQEPLRVAHRRPEKAVPRAA